MNNEQEGRAEGEQEAEGRIRKAPGQYNGESYHSTEQPGSDPGHEPEGSEGGSSGHPGKETGSGEEAAKGGSGNQPAGRDEERDGCLNGTCEKVQKPIKVGPRSLGRRWRGGGPDQWRYERRRR